ncbi:radical SAM family heme chaperone HemW [Clostridium frigidicarnis]|uniref:Heme chaperone HemW n=1 Tax=Clostridium frigidicarnis TaxID=84698 RepID=A0A1I0VGL3_9CLOT|nr:radical SAM family heme chaperone HemW [Clostridium frigidicarnis]SFA75514.1 coproporphyrinogen III oxidase, anaerobic [Clostridium frigidicarnis]
MKEIGLYIHIPFCKQKCWYCDFPSFPCKEYLMEEYIEALIKEVNYRIGNNININTIFIGGGTPTYLSSEQLLKLGDKINELNLNKNIEFSVEANPGTLSEEKLKALKAIGVNRLSMGLQAVQDYHLKAIGRIHTFKEFKENFKMARKIGFDNINIDLMFGLPNQNLEEWIDTLNTICDLNPEHISAYGLILEEGTAFYKLYENNKLHMPDEKIERKMYKSTLEILNRNGYEQYEISNFSKKDKECKHNLIYWNLDEYIGVGSGSSSYLDNLRTSNESNIEKYIESIDKGDCGVKERFENSINDNMEEFMFMGLRKIKGISIKKFHEKFNKNIYQVYGEIINKHKKLNLLEEKDGNLALTSKGIEISNFVMSDFIID